MAGLAFKRNKGRYFEPNIPLGHYPVQKHLAKCYPRSGKRPYIFQNALPKGPLEFFLTADLPTEYLVSVYMVCVLCIYIERRL